jgi:hypothetical protein
MNLIRTCRLYNLMHNTILCLKTPGPNMTEESSSKFKITELSLQLSKLKPLI